MGETGASADADATWRIFPLAECFQIPYRPSGPFEQERITLMQNDIQMQHDVVAALDRAQHVIAGSIGVEVHHGVVKLAGEVSDDAIREESKLAAHGVPGVTSVVMDVDVKGRPPKATTL
jgi:hypothetical protein